MTEQEEELPFYDQGKDRASKIMAVELGLEAQKFLRTNLGRALIEKAEHENGQFLEALVDAAWSDAELNLSLRNEIKLRHLALNWLYETIGTGELAANEIHDDPQPMED